MKAITKTKWAVDPNHSEVQFKVKHLMISNVSGTFKIFKGEVESESEDFNNAQIRFEVDTNSIDTNHEERNGHLKSPLFLNTEKFPRILFEGILKKKDENYELDGEITLCGVKKGLKLEVEHTGIGMGRFGDTRAGFEVNGKINRKDFGMNMALATEAGNLVVGEEIKLHFDIELLKQAA
ncbi:MAG TPA: YceI family protein [Bacteroidia bacterium]|jgi:polyisoprenoid-binding protein YceI|nr:YceI family protein [Bacteroidia bacterium]